MLSVYSCICTGYRNIRLRLRALRKESLNESYIVTRQNILFLSILRSTSLLTKIQKLHLLGTSSVRVLQTNQSSQVYRGGSTTAAASKMDCFVIIVNGWKPFTKRFILDVAVVLDPPLKYTQVK